jgi:ferredoxin/flavodoxin---NADP+ reductase
MTETLPTPAIPVDLAIIGAGPAGLYAAFYAGMRHLSVTLIDSLPNLGGQLIALYPEKLIYDVAGYPAIRAKDLTARLIEQGLQYQPEVRIGEQATHLIRNDTDGLWVLETDQSTIVARTMLIAAGIGAFAARRLPVPGAERFVGRGLHYTVGSIEQFRDRRVLIVGGGDSAVDWANLLAGVTREQTLIHRTDRFRAHEGSVQQLLAGPTRVLTFHELRELQGDDARLRQVTLYHHHSDTSHTLGVDDVLVNIGYTSTLGPLKAWGLTIEQNAIRVDHRMMSNLPGVFAAGDVATYPGKLKLISVGFAEAAIAVNHAKQFIDPSSRLFPGHSSEIKR